MIVLSSDPRRVCEISVVALVERDSEAIYHRVSVACSAMNKHKKLRIDLHTFLVAENWSTKRNFKAKIALSLVALEEH